MFAGNSLTDVLARERDRLTVSELIDQHRERLLGDLMPPVFRENYLWKRLGFTDGLELWRKMVDHSGDTSRAAPIVTKSAWKALLKLEISRRARLFSTIQTAGAAAGRAHYTVCASEPLKWLYDCGWLRDPQQNAPLDTSPFLPFPAQVAAAIWFDGLEGHIPAKATEDDADDCESDAEEESEQVFAAICKSRSLGISWLIVHLMLHGALFTPGYEALMGSISGSLADSAGGDFKTLLGKADFVFERQPPWLTNGMTIDRARYRFKMQRGNALESSLQGSTMNGEFGRGMRLRKVLLDERAFVKRNLQKSVSNALESVAKVVVSVSTPRGRGDEFHEAFTKGPRELSLIMPWTVDPRRDDAWRRSRLIGHGGNRTREEAAREFDCSFAAITGHKIWPESVGIGYNERTPEWAQIASKTRSACEIIGGADFGESRSATVMVLALLDYTKTVPTSEWGNLPRIWIDAEVYDNGGTSEEVAFALARMAKSHFPNRRIDSMQIYGDPTGDQKQIEGLTWYKQLRKLGVPLTLLPSKHNSPEEKAIHISIIAELMRQGGFRIHETRASASLWAAESWEWQIPEGVAPELASHSTVKPKKDGPSHFGDGFRYLLGALLERQRAARYMRPGLGKQLRLVAGRQNF
jgi:hypothetical protein